MKPRLLRVLFVSFLAALLAATSWSQVEVDPDQHYLLLAATRTSTMQEELSEAAALGFRIVVGSPTSADEMVILLERVATPPDVYSYPIARDE